MVKLQSLQFGGPPLDKLEGTLPHIVSEVLIVDHSQLLELEKLIQEVQPPEEEVFRLLLGASSLNFGVHHVDSLEFDQRGVETALAEVHSDLEAVLEVVL